jgi:hypothetical protein
MFGDDSNYKLVSCSFHKTKSLGDFVTEISEKIGFGILNQTFDSQVRMIQT